MTCTSLYFAARAWHEIPATARTGNYARRAQGTGLVVAVGVGLRTGWVGLEETAAVTRAWAEDAVETMLGAVVDGCTARGAGTMMGLVQGSAGNTVAVEVGSILDSAALDMAAVSIVVDDVDVADTTAPQVAMRHTGGTAVRTVVVGQFHVREAAAVVPVALETLTDLASTVRMNYRRYYTGLEHTAVAAVRSKQQLVRAMPGVKPVPLALCRTA